AVLALGGIVIMYTLIVSTMNTAQEGQMLGQKWSSIWIPLRSTLGLALLIPKASGYCLMQIFVMWIVVQGVGAADKVWNAALNYLNTGGVLVQTQMNPQTSLTSGNMSVATGAAVILQGQVCMLAVQRVLENTLQAALIAKQSPSGPSGPCVGRPSDSMREFCAIGRIPDFLSTVNAVSTQTADPNRASNYSVLMPNFSSGSFAALNGICGTLSWSPFSASDLSSIQTNISSISASDLQTVKMNRATAIQQMYRDLSTTAQIIVANDPALNPNQNSSNANQPNFSDVATQQFGVPYLDSGSPCREVSAQCVGWGRDPASNTAALFSGTEFQAAVTDYNGVMLPTLNLVKQSMSNTNANKERDFIKEANSQGWILAGSYFFKLSMLNASAMNNGNLTDSSTGLDGSTFDPSKIVSSFSSQGCKGKLCEWLENKAAPISHIVSLINGTGILTAPLPAPSVNPTGHSATSGLGSSTVNGFINNSVMVNLPGQPGMKPPTFAMKFNLDSNFGQFKLERQNFPCGEWGIWPLKFCLGRILGDIFYNGIILIVFNLFLSIIAPFVTIIIQSFLVGPLVAIAGIFQQNVAIIQQPLVNPVVALANMGVNYINYANELWITIIGLSASPFILVLFPLIALILPLLMSWLGIMVSIGFITAYYVPFLPYMIFTFASIAWLMAVIEAMVAAPIVALGVTHPEGHDAFGKGEQAIMILMNVFLRPSMMIIGFIAAIGLSYVSVWIINAGFANAAAFIQGTATGIQWNYKCTNSMTGAFAPSGTGCAAPLPNDFSSMASGYSSWAGIYGFFFSVLIYTIMYLTVVQKAFTLITYLPDKVLRWIGGQPEGVGEQAAQWAEEPRKEVEGGAKETSRASGQRDQQLGGYATQGLGKLKDKSSSSGKTDIDALGGKATQSGE
ncbi:MAG: type IVB secretion system protein DotA, partial [Tatlockia sp.]|nr:type IVB secretion system protein DotA [Tatlockia sp.]